MGLPLSLVLRRSAPTATLAISGALGLTLFAVDHAAGAVAVIAPAVALYSLALTRGGVHLVAAVVAAAAAVMVADVFLAGHNPHALTLQTAAHVALIAVPVLAAEALRNRRSYVQLLVERLEVAERTREEEAQRRAEQERLRIARELHDVVAHTLTTINVQAGVAAHLADREPGRAGSALAAIEAASRDALDELRAILGVLRGPNDTEVQSRAARGLPDRAGGRPQTPHGMLPAPRPASILATTSTGCRSESRTARRRYATATAKRGSASSACASASARSAVRSP